MNQSVSNVETTLSYSINNLLCHFCPAGEVKGHVFDDNNQPVIGANVYWEGTQQGTTTDVDGAFKLKTRKSTNNLVVSYIGYTTFVMPVTNPDEPLQITLKGEVALEEVVISERKMGTIASRTSVLQTQKITYDEICRAACSSLPRVLRRTRL